MADLVGGGLVALALAGLAIRTLGPVRAVPGGERLASAPTSVIDRLLLHRFPLIGLLAILILGSGTFGVRWIAHPVFVIAIATAGLLLIIPFSHVFSIDGFSLHASATRPWSDFTTYRFEGRRLVITGTSWRRRATLYLPASARANLEQLLVKQGLKPWSTPSKPAGDRRQISRRSRR